MRDRVINNLVGNCDWENLEARESVREDVETGYRRILPFLLKQQRRSDNPDEFGNVSNVASIYASLFGLSGGQPGVDVDPTRLRYWTCMFRLRSLENLQPWYSVP